MRDAALQPGIVGAHCNKGLLILDGMAPQLGSYVLPGNNYHVYAYALFWGAVRLDAARRLAVWHRCLPPTALNSAPVRRVAAGSAGEVLGPRAAARRAGPP